MLLTGQPFTEAYSVPASTIPFGNYVLGLDNGVVVLHNLKLGDSAEILRNQTIHNVLLTFDVNWSRVVNKRYSFQVICQQDKDRLLDVLARDHAIITRLMTPDWIEYGVIDPAATKTVNHRTHTDFDLSFTTIFEVATREKVPCSL